MIAFAPTYHQAVEWIASRNGPNAERGPENLLTADLFNVTDEQLDTDIQVWVRKHFRIRNT